MQELKNPLTQVLTWFDSIAPENQSDIAAFVLLAACEEFELSAPAVRYRAWLSEPNLHPLVTLGRAGLLMTVISSSFARPRARPETWATAAANNAVVAAQAKVRGNTELAHILTDANRNSQAHQTQWRSTIASWQALVEGALSPGALEDWFKYAMDTTTSNSM